MNDTVKTNPKAASKTDAAAKKAWQAPAVRALETTHETRQGGGPLCPPGTVCTS